MRKGVSLSINTIVILAISVLVLVTIVAVFLGSSNNFVRQLFLGPKISREFLEACKTACSTGDLSVQLATIKKTDIKMVGDEPATVEDVCKNYYGITDNDDCLREKCGCEPP